ncbi:MAG: LacI family transcriptional regulator [Actinobacteria bacterium]|nr:LacI family transcriptional regulator [Actinomycetota bacterium]MCG2797753.1 LacI family transcriptional regulator [Cellulomonas sp.]
MVDVARLAGVSVKTVSNVVNGYPHIRATTRDRVLGAISELGYEVNITARSLRSGRTGMIGLAVPELAQSYFAELADEVLAAARVQGVEVLISPTGYTREGELAALAGPRRRLIDGLLFSPVAMEAADASLLELDFPVVLLGEQIFSPAIDHVTMRNVEGARAATELLLDLGRRRIAVLGAPHENARGTSILRFEGYRQAFEARHLDLDPRLVAWTDHGWHRVNGAQAIAAVLDSGAEPDGVVAFNDALAIGAMHELQVRGLRVPEDVAVVGFDDTDDARYTLPSLTTVDPGRPEIARVAVDLLCKRIGGEGAPAEPVLHLAQMRVVERGSTPHRR